MVSGYPGKDPSAATECPQRLYYSLRSHSRAAETQLWAPHWPSPTLQSPAWPSNSVSDFFGPYAMEKSL